MYLKQSYYYITSVSM